jgi:hypothetical protein
MSSVWWSNVRQDFRALGVRRLKITNIKKLGWYVFGREGHTLIILSGITASVQTTSLMPLNKPHLKKKGVIRQKHSGSSREGVE